MKIAYISHEFRAKSRVLIDIANDIITEYRTQGFDLTLRQLYYQLVARDYIPNSQKSYTNIGRIVNKARLAGHIDWLAIVDRTRHLRSVAHWEKPQEIIESAEDSYRLDKWNTQKHRVEVWIEKDALTGVIAGICTEMDISYFSCRGYTSQSSMWRAAQRFKHSYRKQNPLILHLGDHDPSGIDMTRDIEDRLFTFGAGVYSAEGFEVKRIALNQDQIEQYNPPPNPTKLSDSRARGYITEYGYDSWELDALEPSVIVNLIRDEVLSVRDDDLWDKEVKHEKEERANLKRFHERYDDIVRFLDNGRAVK